MSGLFQDDPPELPAPPADGPGLFDAAEAAPAPSMTAPYRVLARTWRPRTFDDVIGQDALVRTLRRAFASGRIAHAFMLTGVRGVGKTTTARIIARALNCIGPDGRGGPTADPCGVCPNCVAILADRHPDVQEMDAASRTGVDDVREIIEAVRFRPMQARTKVFIVDEVHMLSRNAFNALLKTLEEPPEHVKFVFATTELRKVPVTVLSRCQRFELRRVSVAELAAHYGRIAAAEGMEASADALAMIARAADGSVRDGLSLLDQAIARASGSIDAAALAEMLGLGDRATAFDLAEAVLAGRTAGCLAVMDQAHARGVDPGAVLQDLLDLLHLLTRLKCVPALRHSTELPELERVRGAALADALSIPVLGRAWQMLLKGVAEVEQAPDRRAAAEMILIRLCHAADLPTPGDLVRQLRETAAVPAGPAAAGPGPSRGPAGRPAHGMAAAALAHADPSPEPAPEPGPEPGPVPAHLHAAAPWPAGWRDAVALVATRRELALHAHLVHSVHLVRYAPPVIELRPEPSAPRDLAARLAALLGEATGTRWTVALSSAPGTPTLAEQAATAEAARRSEAAGHPIVRAILEAFPGAQVAAVRDTRVDAYGLLADSADSAEDADAGDAAADDTDWEMDA